MAQRIPATDAARNRPDPVATQQRRHQDDAVGRARDDAKEISRKRSARLERRDLRIQLQRAQRPERGKQAQQRVPGRQPIGQNLDVFA